MRITCFVIGCVLALSFRTKIIPDGKKTPISDLISIAMCYIFIGCLIILPWTL